MEDRAEDSSPGNHFGNPIKGDHVTAAHKLEQHLQEHK
jgi:hypothetical protein